MILKHSTGKCNGCVEYDFRFSEKLAEQSRIKSNTILVEQRDLNIVTNKKKKNRAKSGRFAKEEDEKKDSTCLKI